MFCQSPYVPKSSSHKYCGDCVENARLRKVYGISVTDVCLMLESQGGKCALCDRPANRIDHDHFTGRVRGMLCGACNVVLTAQRFENPEWRDRALDYIQQGHGQEGRRWQKEVKE
jgi:hypothetical protein